MGRNTGAAIDRARSALADTEARIAEVTAKRAARLLAGDNAAAIGRLDAGLAALRHAAVTERDRIALLEAEAQREANEQRVKENLRLIERIEKKLGERDAAAAELQATLEQADKLFRKMITLARDVRAAWPWAAHDLPPMLLDCCGREA